MAKFDPVDPSSRLCDLMKQGFMKPRKAPRKPKPPAPTVACEDCLNWHAKGKHTSPADVRKARRQERAHKSKIPACARDMGCLCAGHARGNAVKAPCNTRES